MKNLPVKYAVVGCDKFRKGSIFIGRDIMRVEIIEKEKLEFLEYEINKNIFGANVKDIKFTVSPVLRQGHSTNYKYCALIMYEE